ncbi:hypothetical protein KO481_10215 [Nocardia sp. NEAU-G5]|uniref:Transmembrane protein n=1 Tax=Nocardia albiluteola TaxID=2842303 RepID=A0ABS6AV51_9NOCA|nr:hypothetical protein [Nocardia albiluteola]MBU3061899.1 hypothetical protein [Nocardia albiluteola]
MHTLDAIVKSLGEVALVALILGAGLPLIFAVGVRFWSMETTTANGAPSGRNTAAQAIAYLCFGIVIVAVLLGILYIAKDFISHTFDVQLFGAKKS